MNTPAPLTDAEISEAWESHTVPVFGKISINPIVFARAVEAEVNARWQKMLGDGDAVGEVAPRPDIVDWYSYEPTHGTKLYTHPAPPVSAEPVAYFHRQGNHREVSERYLEDDEKSRGWTEEPLFIHPAPNHTALQKAVSKLESATMCHPNGVQPLIEEAITAIKEALK